MVDVGALPPPAASTLVPVHPHFNSSLVLFNLSNIISQSSRLSSGFKSARRFAYRLDLIGLCMILLQAHGFLWISWIVCLVAEIRKISLIRIISTETTNKSTEWMRETYGRSTT
jgi:hypothetical protein